MALRLSMTVFLLLVMCTACGSTRMVRLDTGDGRVVPHQPNGGEATRVELGEEEAVEGVRKHAQLVSPSANPELAARKLFGVSPRSGWYGYNERQGVVPLDEQPPASQWARVDVEITQAYLRYCEARGQPGDCRRVLLNSPVLTGDARYALAMSFAMDEVVPEMMEAFQDMADPEVIKASILWTMAIYAAMWLAPEPVFTKGLATVLTAAFICYVGVDTFWTLIQGWRRMVETADGATTFAQLIGAGERYGKVMGRNAARAFALLLTAAIGQTASSFSAKVPTLPGSAQASVVGASQTGVRLTQVGQVESVVVTADAITIALAPTAVAATAQSVGGAASTPVDAEGPEHHIATDKWTEATHSGGPWTPKFEQIFNQAGMSLNDPTNKVRVRGHVGPHPQEYHEHVFEALREATRTCRTMQQCRASLTKALERLAQQIKTEGSSLNKLVTRT
ncbi:MAG TPA: AHH domain-containing protein [Myxococcaceae bacterium]|nr:AHH domain-containing protein [Myxococcaceae bacterium]